MKKLESVTKIDYSELEKIVIENYGHMMPKKDKYQRDFLAGVESPNDVDYLLESVTGEDVYDVEEFDEILSTRACTPEQFGMLLDRLVKDNHLKSGHYIVQVSW